jgi:hypothetical protein
MTLKTENKKEKNRYEKKKEERKLVRLKVRQMETVSRIWIRGSESGSSSGSCSFRQ